MRSGWASPCTKRPWNGCLVIRITACRSQVCLPEGYISVMALIPMDLAHEPESNLLWSVVYSDIASTWWARQDIQTQQWRRLWLLSRTLWGALVDTVNSWRSAIRCRAFPVVCLHTLPRYIRNETQEKFLPSCCWQGIWLATFIGVYLATREMVSGPFQTLHLRIYIFRQATSAVHNY